MQSVIISNSCKGVYMDNIFKQTLLYDFYGELLNEHQRKVYEDAVFNDLSLSEVADNYDVSRQAIHDLIKRVTKMLEKYENKLHMIERFAKMQDIAQGIKDTIAEYKESRNDKLLDKISEDTELIIDEF